jgi:hypothetical protein
MEKHVTVIAVLRIGFSVLILLGALIVFTSVVGGGLIGGLTSGEGEVIAITASVGTTIALFLALLAVPGIIGGVGLIRRWPWARYLVMVLAVLDLFNIPVGTAVGIYTLWVLMQDEVAELFAREEAEEAV